MRSIDIPEVLKRVGDGRTQILEVLPRHAYDQGHLPGAAQVTNAELADRATELVPDKDAPVVVYCSGPTCANSHQAAVTLRALGYRDVAVFTGGKAAWREAGLAFEGIAAPDPLDGEASGR
jgi:rhodanese-related sulfurtransferase